MVDQQTRRWLAAGCFEAIVHDLRTVLRFADKREPKPTAVIFDGRPLQSTPESGGRAGYDGYKRRKGAKFHMAVDTLGHLLALHVTPANEQERAQVDTLAKAVQEATGESVELAYVDQGYTGEEAFHAAAHQGIIRQLRFNPNGTLLTAAGAPGSGVEIWDPASHTALAVLTVPNLVADLAFSADGHTLAAASSTASTSVWAVVDPVVRSQINSLDTLPTSLAFGSDQRLAIGSAKGTIRAWNPGHCPSTTQQVKAAPPPGAMGDYVQGDRATTLIFNEKDRLIAVDPEAIPSHHHGARRSPPRMYPSPVASAKQGQTLFVARGHQIMVWNSPAEPQRWSSLEIPRPRTSGLLANSDRARREREPDPWRQLAANSTGDRLYLLDSHSIHAVALDGGRARNLEWHLPDDANRLSLSPDGKTLAVGDKEGNVYLVDTARGTIRTRLPLPSSESDRQPIWALAFSPDGQELAVGLQQGHIDLWSLKNPTAPLLRLTGHRGFISTLAYDPKGRFFASTGSDKLVDIWDLDHVRSELGRLGLNW